ncbi:MFS transporter [Streptomyces cinereospinus]|uniref:MFS transporter n=1 Tax=Streptomyces cinereospinus TaxID=285561 RepID=A0ABV5N0H4_9ACTN
MPVSAVSTQGARLLTASAGAQLLLALDFSILCVALPDIGTSLHFSAVAPQWIVSAYAVFFAGFLLLGGQFADVFGAGRVCLTAQLLFAASSIGAALSSAAAPLIAARPARPASGRSPWPPAPRADTCPACCRDCCSAVWDRERRSPVCASPGSATSRRRATPPEAPW